MKTLIVDDEFTCSKLLQIHLSKYGQCLCADNGVEAVEAVRQSVIENAPFDLVCMDIEMPGMNGVEAVRQIREIEQQNNIIGPSGVKIIMTTTKDYSKDINGAFQAGCEGYLVKPVHKKDLLAKIEELGLMTAEQTAS